MVTPKNDESFRMMNEGFTPWIDFYSENFKILFD
jgi:hypothetical protein